MNIEIYSLNSGKSDKEFKKNLPMLITRLNRRNMHVLNNTEVDNDEESLIKAILSSEKSQDEIEMVIIRNAYDSSKDNTVHNTLCQLCSCDYTPVKQMLNELNKAEDESDLTSIQELSESGVSRANAVSLGDIGKGNEAYCFFYNNLCIITLPDEALTGVKTEEMIKEAVESAALRTALPNESVSELGLEFVIEPIVKKKKKKKRGFLKSVIPMKGDKPAEVIRKLILIAASLTFIITAGYLINYLVIAPMLNDNLMNDLRATVSADIPRVPENQVDDDGEDKPKSSRNWKELQKVNKEIVAWLQIPDTKIDYPVVSHKGDDINNQYYLYRDINGNSSGYGSIFIDYRSEGNVNAKNVIMHGHHMQDGRMFQNLMNYGTYSGNLDYYKEHPIVYFDTPEGDCDWKIISIYKTNTLDQHGDYFDYLTGTFNSDAEFMNYVYLIRERSLIDCPVTVNEDDQLISLSTCSYEYSEFRTIVVARKCRPGESSDVDVKKAKVNEDALWPDVYYSANGGSKPKVTSFSKAYKAKEIDWYDGKGKLKGKERAFTLHDAADAAAANNNSSSSSTELNLKEKGISFRTNEITLENGTSSRLTVVWNPDNVADKTLEWSTTDVGVADIDSDGVVYAMSPGTAVITAKSKNGYEAKCEVTVLQPVTQMSINYSGYDFYEGSSIQLTATIGPDNASDKTLHWSSSDPSVATVDKNGLVKGISPGYAVITVKSSNDLELTCEVNIMPLQ
ncbi:MULTISPECIES: class B sortase [unclassified Ruminococcus]|uniref:class B sortase n=1 Tax=unclassified Ruminococcus TaxID=2608920 RepID=UPI00210D9AB0|nr:MULTISPECIES: class B sortase [unclassified Ruminococcus]MCQ4022227.1 class B sortase [Ruminococcus sp. zg-924]MCQ4115210.1 class B sortase [Ruminococcus sp. zg-921]